jgi:hypothetical protein
MVEGAAAGPVAVAAAAMPAAGWEDINAMLTPVTDSCVTGFCWLPLLLLLAGLFPASRQWALVYVSDARMSHD